MSPSKSEFLIPLVLFIVVFSVAYLRNRKLIEKFINLTWFKKKTFIYGLRKVTYLLGIALLLVSLLDFRGPEEKIESDIPDQKTIIIIDSSASMLAEDVRPNRFQKSLIMARHFVKKAFGHKIAVVLFSDQQKRLVPFTDDLDLLDARISGLESIDLYDGGSNISQAIKESIGYFRNSSHSDGKLVGNILVFTDSEGHDEDFTFSLPKTITLGVVGVGTLQGARIPHRDGNGVFRGYKKFDGKEVVTKLNEQWLKSLSSKVNNYKYWVASSYTIPTEQILSFFNKSFEKRMSKGLTTVRPVEVEKLLIPGMILLILSFLLYPTKSFKFILALGIGFSFVTSENVIAQNTQQIQKEQLSEEQLKQQNEKYELLNSLMNKHKSGQLETLEKMKMAELLTEHESYEMANTIYEESLDEMTAQNKNNYAYNLIKNKQAEEAVKVLSEIQLRMDKNKELDENFQKSVRQNMLLALAEDKKQKQQKKEDEEKKKQQEKENENKQKKEGGEGSEDQKQSKDKKGASKDGQQNKNDKESEKNDNEKKDDKQSNKDDKGEEKKNKQPKSLKEKQKDIERKRKMVKIPGLIKQLMSDDRSLQQKYIDTSTDKPKSFKKKDW